MCVDVCKLGGGKGRGCVGSRGDERVSDSGKSKVFLKQMSFRQKLPNSVPLQEALKG